MLFAFSLRIGNKAQKISRILDFAAFRFSACKDMVCAMRKKKYFLFFILHHMTWMIKHLYFYASFCASISPIRPRHNLNAILHSSRDIHIKNSFVKCDRELMAFLLMNHRMEIEFYVWKGLAFISVSFVFPFPLRSLLRESNIMLIAKCRREGSTVMPMNT